MKKASLSSNVEKTLADRQKTHGDFNTHSKISQALKGVVLAHATKTNDAQDEALEMICHKIARILNGDPNVHDHWHDIAGYATLVAKELEK